MKYDRAFFDAGIDRHNTECEKWDDREVLSEDALALWVADMDFACAAPIAEAIRQRAEHPCFGYRLYEEKDEAALRGYWLRRHQLDIPAGKTCMLPCVITGLKACVRAFTQPGDGVALFAPVYGPFYDAVRKNGRRVVSVPLIREEETGRYQMNLAGMEEALKGGARLIMLCSPHNPVSRLWSRDELRALCALARQYDAKIVCDEIHADFVYAPAAFTPLLSLEEARERAVMLCSASKTFNVAGLQQAMAVCFRDDMRSAIGREMDAAGVVSGNMLAIYATRAAYTACDDWLDGLLAYLDSNRKEFKSLTAELLPRAALTPIDATYLAWLDLRAYGKSCDEMSAACRRHKVALVKGTAFGPEGEGFMRVNFACPAAMLREGMRRVAEAMREE